MDNNITEPTQPAVDKSLLVSGAAADSAVVGQEISDLKSALASLSSIPVEVKRAMDALFHNMAVKDDAVYSDEYATFHSWATAVNLVSITAVFEQNDHVVLSADSLDSLKEYLTVTALYDDGTTGAVNTYTLSGELTAGTSLITVTYLDKTTTFTVNVTASTDITPAYTSAVATTNVSITQLNDGMRLQTTTNSTYQFARIPVPGLRANYTYRVEYDEEYTSGTIVVQFRVGTTTTAPIIGTSQASSQTPGGHFSVDLVFSDDPDWSTSAETNTNLFFFITAGTAQAGNCTFKNLRILEYMTGGN
jgi:hypothetical protein